MSEAATFVVTGETVRIVDLQPADYAVGFLGARAEHPALAQGARDEMIERRILRIEMALRRPGIEVEMFDLPKVRS